MADIKITDLAAYTDPVSTDVLPIVDVGSDLTKKVSIADLLENAGTGSAAAPSFSFDGDNNTGIYRPGADQVALTAGGTQAFLAESTGITIPGTTTATGLISADGKVSFPLGTAALPSLYPGSDTNTGIYSPGANQLAVATNGTERLRIDSSGRVGIGISTPGQADGAGLKVEKYIDRNATYYAPDGHYAGSFGLTNDTQDKVWIAIDSGYYKTSSVSAGVFLSAFHADTGGSGCGSTIKNLKSDNSLSFSAVTTASSVGSPAIENERMRIDSPGNLLLGGTLPSSPNIELNADGRITAAGTVTALALVADSALTSAVVQLKQTNGIYNLESTAGDFRIYRTDGGSPGEKFRVQNSGDVKIGGTLPSAPNIALNANGSAEFKGRITAENAFQSERTSAGNSVLVGKLNGVQNVNITANGSATFGGDITCSDNSKGLILKSPDGTSFRLSVANDGTLSASQA